MRHMPMALLLGAILASSLAPGSMAAPTDLVIHGDSTGRGDGAQTRWPDRLLAVLGEPRAIENLSVSRQDIRRIVRGMLTLAPHDGVTILYDRRNAGETPEAYLDYLKQGVAALGSNRFLIMPQVPVSGGGEDRLTLEVLLAINVLLRESFPDNTLDAETEARLLEALRSDETRSDRVHRNDIGQQIEAEFIAAWLKQRGW
ncbi:hypothetical protein [Devosia ginsengisoli]|uniref:hypothetical protein n=1 Tax=Devosia ginsengisoli TaxID=400770 RepID=UPI0026EABDED|nr:hypothetical protein [Devosia ginsengisoli]MCR6672732.1 hypothetical protein [Devosia ginsengisoli]